MWVESRSRHQMETSRTLSEANQTETVKGQRQWHDVAGWIVMDDIYKWKLLYIYGNPPKHLLGLLAPLKYSTANSIATHSYLLHRECDEGLGLFINTN